MATFTVRPEGIIRQPALTIPGNATGSEASCTALTGSQIRALCGLGTTDAPTFGGLTLNGHLLLSPTNTYDIGNGTLDPRTVRAATSVLTPAVSNTASQLTLTGGPDAGYFSFPSVLLKTTTSSTEYVRSYSGGGTQVLALHSSGVSPAILMYYGVNGQLTLQSQATPGHIVLRGGSTNGKIYCYNSASAMTTLYASTVENADAAATTLGNSTYGVTVPGAATFSGDISMQKATQGYIYAYSPDGTKSGSFYCGNTGLTTLDCNASFDINSTNGRIRTSGTTLEISPAGGSAYVFRSGANSTFDVYNSGSPSSRYIRLTHDSTNGILSTSSGNLNLVPTGGTVAVTGAVTASGNVNSAVGFGVAPSGTRQSLHYYSSFENRWYSDNGYPMVIESNNGLKVRNTANNADAAITCAGITASGVVSHGAYTVATLPAAGSNAGKMAQVTDSNVAASGNYGATVAAGGANRVKVFSDGTNWVIA